ncbi:flavoprotein family [Papiliotrema laurentii]|uniref:Flavin prenyltransferase PAD1, mitochondrial n=1 Tax=Papiliotrema laurentii TaxID=5418 RepID=A0AAD9CT82_PAPLA|nr:flavoprotein family [Papiliotrema laurentii]
MFSNIHVPTFGKSTPSSTTHESDSDNEHHRGAPLDVQTGRVDLLNEDVPFRLIPEDRRKRMVVAITGATGITIAIRLLQALRAIDVETHLIMSKWAGTTLKYETDYSVAEVKALADFAYSFSDVAAPPSSGSFILDGMFIVPCSMKTLAAVRIGLGDELIARAADVCLKENRKLLLAVREMPLNEIHLENMLAMRRAGAVIFPPVPAYYIRPKSLQDLTDQTVGRMLDAFGIHTTGFERWKDS